MEFKCIFVNAFILLHLTELGSDHTNIVTSTAIPLFFMNQCDSWLSQNMADLTI